MKNTGHKKKLYGYRENHKCYYCGREGGSREHVPPKAMFVNYNCDSITVPSCDTHNQAKSGVDEKILLAMAMIIEAGILDFPDHPILTKNVLSEYAYLRQHFAKAKSLANRIVIWGEARLDTPGEGVKIESISTIATWVKQLTAGLVWSVTGQHYSSLNWDEALAFDPYIYPLGPFADDEILAQSVKVVREKEILDGLEWHPGWTAQGRGYPSEIYRFAVSFDSYEGLPGCNVVFKHVFYNGCTEWYVGFQASEEMKEAIRLALDEIKSSAQGKRKQLLSKDDAELVMKVEKSQGESGWNQYPSEFISVIKERLGDEFAKLSRLAQKYRLFEQPFFKRPSNEFQGAEFQADLLGFLVGSLGNQLAMHEMFEDAETAFKLSLKLKSEDNPTHMSLANLYLMQGKIQLAVPHLAEAERILKGLAAFASEHSMEDIIGS
jgi:tetratricopeptide (TPR) repeat protein